MRGILVLLAMAACAPDDTPRFAADTLWVEPGPDGSASGFVTWSVYGPGWEGQRRPRHYVCAVVRQLMLAPSDDGCEGCEVAWTVVESEVETDCDADPLPAEAAITAIGFGPLDPTLVGEPPWPDVSTGSWIRYDDTAWTAHGWAFPGSEPDGPVDPPVWDAAGPVTAWPAFAWDL